MLKLLIFFISFFVFFKPVFASDEYRSNKQLKESFPLSILVSVSPDQNIVLENPTKYLNQLDKDVVNSILSEKEIWKVHKIRQSEEDMYHYMKQFYAWYFNQLPLIIFADKKGFSKKESLSTALLKDYFAEINFLFLADYHIKSKDLISLTDRYKYTFSEKLNLFLSVLYKNISPTEILKLQKAWGITNNVPVYVRDYQEHIEKFFQNLAFPSDNKRKSIIFFFNTIEVALTSVLHELFMTDRKVIFSKMIKRPGVNVNIQNYLLQTIAHKVANSNWSKSSHYLPFLLKHPDINLNIKDYQGWTPIFYAISQSESRLSPALQQFMQYKSKINMDILDHHLRTMPLVAAELNKPALAHFLHSEGAPLPSRVSLLNSYITEDYKTIRFKHKTKLDINNLEILFKLNDSTPSFEDFQKHVSSEQFMETPKFWDQFKHYFLFYVLNQTFSHEEDIRYATIMPWLFDGESTKMNNGFDTQLIKAMYQDDISVFKSMFSKQADKSTLNDSLFYIQYVFEKGWNKKVLLDFRMLESKEIEMVTQSDGDLLFYMEVSSLLSEAIRANRADVVKFLLKEGADPTREIKSFVIKNSIVTAILMGDLLYRYPDFYKEHLRIVDMLMEHPSVTKEFLSKNVIPGITYADLSALKGHFNILKHIYKKRVHVTEDKTIWETGFPIESALIESNLIKTTKFILEEKIKRYPNDYFKNSLRRCKRAFN